MMKGEGQSMRIALEFLSKIFRLLSAVGMERILQPGKENSGGTEPTLRGGFAASKEP